MIFGWYVLAKLLETFDAPVLEHSHLVSGHTLKHVAAAWPVRRLPHADATRAGSVGASAPPSVPGRTA